MRLHWDEVDGVPTVWAEEGQVQGPLQACLSFGVGRSDETLATAGIDHVIEHLTLQAVGRTPYQWNGWTSPVTTGFSVAGAPDQVAEFFGIVTRQVGDLPLQRLEDEIQVLRIEEAGRTGQLGFDLASRYGPHGAGLIGWPEYGLRTLHADQVEAWARERFTAANAVLWLSGPVPPGLRLDALASGEAVERAVTPASLLRERAYLDADTRKISVSFVSRLQWGVLPMMQIARDRAFDRLRSDAVSYSVDLAHVRIGGGAALEFLQADGSAGALERVASVMVEVVDELAGTGPDQHELDLLQEQKRQFRDHPDQILSYLDSMARARLLDGLVQSPEEIDAIFDGYDVHAYRADLSAVTPTAVAIGPAAIGERLEGWTVDTGWSEERLFGTSYPPIANREQGTLVVGDEGISWELDEERRRTVRWDAVEACFAGSDGARRVVGTGGAVVQVVPWHWQGGTELAIIVDREVGADRTFRMRAEVSPPSTGDEHDVRWLGSIVGALDRRRVVDLVVDTDGVFVLYPPEPHQRPKDRVDALSKLDREGLLAIGPGSFWIAEAEIESVTIRRKPVTFTNWPKATLTIAAREGRDYKFSLMSSNHVDIAQRQFANMVGARLRT
jgi:hypothetical protein